jgi:hypothetical protein
MRLEDVLFWFFILFALFLLILKLKDSPSTETITAALVGGFGLLWKEFSDLKGEIRERMERLESKINLIWKDFKRRKRI